MNIIMKLFFSALFLIFALVSIDNCLAADDFDTLKVKIIDIESVVCEDEYESNCTTTVVEDVKTKKVFKLDNGGELSSFTIDEDNYEIGDIYLANYFNNEYGESIYLIEKYRVKNIFYLISLFVLAVVFFLRKKGIFALFGILTSFFSSSVCAFKKYFI